jgi:hypothetical protein
MLAALVNTSSAKEDVVWRLQQCNLPRQAVARRGTSVLALPLLLLTLSPFSACSSANRCIQ